MVLYISSFIISLFLAFAVKVNAFTLGLVDCPSERSSHNKPTPKGGGIGILVVLTLASIILEIPYTFWVPATFLSLLSFFGDRYSISPKIRLPLQFIAALILVHFAEFGFVPSTLLNIAMVLFIVGTANCYNFMDGINGIAGLTGLVGFGSISLYCIFVRPESNISALSICLALACLGFLPFNFPKAKLFMGDVGSILLGFVYAALVVVLSKSFLEFICLAAFLFPFYADELITMTVRIRNGENLLLPHRKHFYQLLANEMGIDHWKISIGYALAQIIVGVLIMLARPFGILFVSITILTLFISFILANYFVRKRMVAFA